MCCLFIRIIPPQQRKLSMILHKVTSHNTVLIFDIHRATHRNIISTVKPNRCTNVSNLFYFGMTLHVSDNLSGHHQQFKTVRTATGICQTNTAVCLLAGTRWNCRSISYPLASRQQYLFDKCLLLDAQS